MHGYKHEDFLSVFYIPHACCTA